MTTDAGGNVAADGGDVFKKLARLSAGVAMSMAMQTPVMAASSNFAIRAGYGNYDGVASAYGLSAVGVLCRDCFIGSDRVSIDISAATGSSSYYSQDSGYISAVRVGAQLEWK